MNGKITCIGTGSMGGAIFRAVCKEIDSSIITVTNRTAAKGEAFAKETGCNFSSSNVDAVKDAKYVFIAVKPVALEALCKEIKEALSEDAVIISMAAGVKLEKIASYLPSAKIVRIMPNVPAQIGQAMTALCYNNKVSEEEISHVKQILECCGKVEVVDEKLMDCVTAVSGSSPAFVFMFIEAMADAAVRCGMPRSQAYTFAAQTVKGSAELVLETGKHPGALKDSVTSPGGTTIEGVAALEREGFRNAVIEAITAACNKSISMGK